MDDQTPNGSQDQQGAPDGGQQQVNAAPAWIAQLPDDLKGNEAFTGYKTIGDLAKDHLVVKGKATELEGKLGTDYVPKLTENATQEQRDAYYKAIGRPDKPEGYEFGKPDNWPEGVPYSTERETEFRQKAFEIGLPKDAAEAAVKWYNDRLVALHTEINTQREQEKQKAISEIKTEWGNKFDENAALAKRVADKLVTTNQGKEWLIAQDDPMLMRLLVAAAPAFLDDTTMGGRPQSSELSVDEQAKEFYKT